VCSVDITLICARIHVEPAKTFEDVGFGFAVQLLFRAQVPVGKQITIQRQDLRPQPLAVRTQQYALDLARPAMDAHAVGLPVIGLVRESRVTGQGEAIRRKPDLIVGWF